MCWFWENRSTDVLIGEIYERCTYCETFMLQMPCMWADYVRDVLNERKLCERCTECEKSIIELYRVW